LADAFRRLLILQTVNERLDWLECEVSEVRIFNRPADAYEKALIRWYLDLYEAAQPLPAPAEPASTFRRYGPEVVPFTQFRAAPLRPDRRGASPSLVPHKADAPRHPLPGG